MSLDPAEVAAELAAGLNGGSPPASPFVDWSSFWAKDHAASDWLYEPILARGRGHSLYARHKTGKSLLMLWLAAQLAEARDDVLVVYLDYEMTEADLQERLEDMGHGATSDLSRLRYWLLPTLPPLDTAEGAAALLARVDSERMANPDLHVALVIDTISRAVAGEENSNDTILGFYRHTGLGLKQRGVTWARLDHEGKDPSKGARGGSSKGDDVDLAWRLVDTDDGLELRRELTRIGWAPERVALGKVTEPVLAFRIVTDSWPKGTLETAAEMDRLGVPLDAGYRVAQVALKEVDKSKAARVIRAAMRYRRDRQDHPGAPSDAPPDAPPERLAGRTSGRGKGKAHNQGADAPSDALGRTPAGHGGRRASPPRGRTAPSPSALATVEGDCDLNSRCARCGGLLWREPGQKKCTCDEPVAHAPAAGSGAMQPPAEGVR